MDFVRRKSATIENILYGNFVQIDSLFKTAPHVI